MQQRGFTLIELMVTMVILVILIQGSNRLIHHLLPQSRLTADTNHVVGLLARARHHALFHDMAMVCALHSQCQQFKKENGLVLLADSNYNHHYDTHDAIIQRLTLHPHTHISWHSFRGKPALAYHHNGSVYFQNGHFLICNRHAGAKVILNTVGRPRVEQVDFSKSCINTSKE